MITVQEEFWKNNFGDEYIERNFFTVEQQDESYRQKFGIARTEMNKKFLSGLNLENILEVGCNVGNQLLALENFGYKQLYGIEINERAVQLAKKRALQFNIVQGSALDLPFKDNFFDLVFTSGVLIHISPADLGQVMSEIHRVSKKYIWGFEYFLDKHVNINYRGHLDRLWKGNFCEMYLSMFSDLKLVREEKYKYLQEGNIDSMFLLEKV